MGVKLHGLHYVGATIFLLLLGISQGVRIVALHVPSSVRNGTESVILDCEYLLGEDDLRPVLKWFFNESPIPVYQWIVDLDARHVGPMLRDYLDLHYTADAANNATRYRALKILNPTPELSGKYTCLVSSLVGQQTMSKNMTVYVPPKEFAFNITRNANNSSEVACWARDTFPQPRATITLVAGNGRYPLSDTVESVTLAPDGLYDVKLSKKISTADSFMFNTRTLECTIEIPDANYKVHRRIEYDAGSSSGNSQSMRVANTCTLSPWLLYILWIGFQELLSLHR